MCLAVPGRVESLDPSSAMTMAKVDFGGVVKEICVEWVPHVAVGDYVVVHAGFALNVLNEEEAKKTLALLEELHQSPESMSQWDSHRAES